VEVCDGFESAREQKQKDQRGGRRAAGGGRGDQVVEVVKPCASREMSGRQYGAGYAETKESYIWWISPVPFCCCT